MEKNEGQVTIIINEPSKTANNMKLNPREGVRQRENNSGKQRRGKNEGRRKGKVMRGEEN